MNLWTVSPVSIDDELLRFPSCHVSPLYKISLLQSHTSSSHVTILTQFPSSMWFPRWNGLFRSSFTVWNCSSNAGKKHASRNQKSYCWALKSLLQATSLLQVQSLLNVFFEPSSAFLFFLLILFFTDFSYRNMDAIQSFNHFFFFLKSDKQILGDIFGICIKSHRDLKHSYLSFSADRECIYLQIPI